MVKQKEVSCQNKVSDAVETSIVNGDHTNKIVSYINVMQLID
ncbi:hypothetical protein [Polluticoccus soli]|nr:hypothetical protein [Flavipsychrobacter sp. JY13-12]